LLCKSLSRCLAAGALPVLAACSGQIFQAGPLWGAERSARQVPPPSLDALIKQVEDKPASAAAHLALARRYEDQGFLSLARDQYEQATNCPDAPPESFKLLAQVSLRMQMGKEAEAIVRKAAQRFPDDFGIYLTAGYVFQNQKHFDEALRMYEHAARLQPSNPAIHGALADNLIAMKRFDQALAEADRSLSLLKDFDVGYYEKARALAALGRPEEAIGLLEKNFRRNPLGSLNNKLYAGTLLQANKPDQALVPLLSLLAISDGVKMAQAKTEIAQIIMRMQPERVLAAITASDTALARTGVRARMHFAMGDVFDKLNRHAEAMREYERGIAIDPQYARGYLRLAEDQELYARDYEKAMSNYRKASALDSRDQEIRLRMERLTRTIAEQRNPFLQIQNWFNSLFRR